MPLVHHVWRFNFLRCVSKIPMKPIKKLDLGTMERDFSGQKSTVMIPAYVALKIALWSCQQQSYRQTRLPVLEIWCQPLVTLFTTCQAHNYMLPWRFCIGMTLLGFCCSGYWSNTLHSSSDPGKSCTVVLEVNLSTCSPLWSSAHPHPMIISQIIQLSGTCPRTSVGSGMVFHCN